MAESYIVRKGGGGADNRSIYTHGNGSKWALTNVVNFTNVGGEVTYDFNYWEPANDTKKSAILTNGTLTGNISGNIQIVQLNQINTLNHSSNIIIANNGAKFVGYNGYDFVSQPSLPSTVNFNRWLLNNSATGNIIFNNAFFTQVSQFNTNSSFIDATKFKFIREANLPTSSPEGTGVSTYVFPLNNLSVSGYYRVSNDGYVPTRITVVNTRTNQVISNVGFSIGSFQNQGWAPALISPANGGMMLWRNFWFNAGSSGSYAWYHFNGTLINSIGSGQTAYKATSFGMFGNYGFNAFYAPDVRQTGQLMNLISGTTILNYGETDNLNAILGFMVSNNGHYIALKSFNQRGNGFYRMRVWNTFANGVANTLLLNSVYNANSNVNSHPYSFSSTTTQGIENNNIVSFYDNRIYKHNITNLSLVNTSGLINTVNGVSTSYGTMLGIEDNFIYLQGSRNSKTVVDKYGINNLSFVGSSEDLTANLSGTLTLQGNVIGRASSTNTAIVETSNTSFVTQPIFTVSKIKE